MRIHNESAVIHSDRNASGPKLAEGSQHITLADIRTDDVILQRCTETNTHQVRMKA